jgi:ribosomal protein L16 Arg81 hydroxylase
MLDLSDENIKAVAEIYIGKLKEDMMTLLETTRNFTENIGKYFSSDRRSTAMTANKQAQQEGTEVVNLLAADRVTTAEPGTEV